MDFLLELLGEYVLDASIETLEKKKSVRWKRLLAYGIFLLFLLLYGFILYGALCLSIIMLKNKEYGMSILFGFVSVIIIIWLFIQANKVWNAIRSRKKEISN